MSTTMQPLDTITQSFGLKAEQSESTLNKLAIEDTGNVSAINQLFDDYYARNLAALSIILANNESIENYNKSYIQKAIERIDALVSAQLNAIISQESFKQLHTQWLQIQDVFNGKGEDDKIDVCLLDVSKDELQYDFERNLYDISSSDLFQKVYVDEFDQYGGEPYGLLMGMYDFSYHEEDITWLSGMGMVAEGAHAPFLGAVNLDFFGVENASELRKIKSFESLMEHPRYRHWNDFRETDQAAYIGLCVGQYIVKQPYHPTNNAVPGKSLKGFSEVVDSYESKEAYLWASTNIHMARNIMRSYDKTGWMQYIRGPENGGYVENLLAPVYNINGYDEQRSALDVSFADYMELSLANVGLIPLIEEKRTKNAAFFSVQSIKKVNEFVDDMDSINSQLVANLSYTLSISRIAHYIKCVIREKIGSVVSKEVIYNIINDWIQRYVTIAFKPTPLEMAKYPFRAAEVVVNPIPGKAGWYKTQVTLLPHIQFEGMDTTLKVDAKLDPSLFTAN
ncbi:type VI secretion system contractile sheath large subunit [Facilibium subflavum]|uniref:type VI secretion system contractile sheath large subunit n=1 Tax=Facilibium subflavum TaxID=2219058 RepID=UPI000E65ABD6|nr:type VI secretion system contractile sheath large subunit [Facilibium subflavum]